MISRKNRTRKANVLTAGFLSLVVLCSFTGRTQAEERKYVVMMAHSPKAFVTDGIPGLPPGGLMNVEDIRKAYFDHFDPNIASFAEYWEEISYGDVTIGGDALEWVTLPWAMEPFGPNHPARNSAADYIDLFGIDSGICINAPAGIPPLFAYGAGEVYCDCIGTGDNTPEVTRDDCGALIIIDLIGDPNPRTDEPERGGGLNDAPAVGINVWTPGERFVDIDDDQRWDGIDEKNDMMCHGPNGCQGICSAMICDTDPPTAYCNTEADCPAGVACKRGSLISDRPCNADDDCSPTLETCGDKGRCLGLFCSGSSTPCGRPGDLPCLPGTICALGTASDETCATNNDCTLFAGPNPSEICVPPGPRGCDTPGCGDLFMPCIDFDGDNDCNNPGGVDPETLPQSGCTPPNFVFCTTNADCPEGVSCIEVESFSGTISLCDPRRRLDVSCTEDDDGNAICPVVKCTSDEQCLNQTCDTDAEVCAPQNLCFMLNPDVDIELPECCAEDLDADQLAQCAASPPDGDGGIILCSRYPNDPTCNPLPEGFACGTPRFCCEFDDFDTDGNVDAVEPFEDFLVRWDPVGSTPGSSWLPVERDYIKNNYPGDVPALLARTGNGYYDPPDLFFDHLDDNDNPEGTKMMQDSGVNQFTWIIPKPGSKSSYVTQADEPTWFDSWWTGRYGSTPPAWPGGDLPSSRNGVRMRSFDPAAPNPPIVGSVTDRRWFRASRGGWNGFGRGTADDTDRELQFDVGGNEWDAAILPEEEYGYYDGWVEHDDLASSRYHKAGDERLGEITSPVRDTIGIFDDIPAIFGDDLGQHDPESLSPAGDNWGVAAGPGAINIHGEKGYDAGDVCFVEWLTWRRDGTSRTATSAWESEHPFGGPPARYHPFATPAAVTNGYTPSGRCSTSTQVTCLSDGDCPAGESCNRPFVAIGFRDYNLDGMIDQGEVRPELSESYSVDSNPFSPNDGTHSDYPFNRSRLTEDVVEALDPSIQWDNFVGSIRSTVRPTRNNIVSGIVLAPTGSYSATNLFPLAPALNWAIHTEDTSFDPRFSDLVTCQNCQGSLSEVQYSSHEMLHSWEGYPDLYDYDVFDEPGTSIINCPVGVWDIMERRGSLVHPAPPLKENLSGWIETVDLRSVLTPGVETTLTLPPVEFVRDESYFFLENGARTGERYYLWSMGLGFDTPGPRPRLPRAGMLIMKTNDFRANFEALALQQRTAPFNFRIIQADGRNDMLACESTGGNIGDAGDVWPGDTNATKFNFETTPRSIWQDGRWTGLDITNVVPQADGSVRLTLKWEPTNLPILKFIDPPGGATVGSVYRIQYEATDVHGRTDINFYHTQSNTGIPDPSTATPIGGTRRKGLPATVRFTQNWDASGLPDGLYYLFAKLTPDTSVPPPPSSEGPEIRHTDPLPKRNNQGDGEIHIDVCDGGPLDGDPCNPANGNADCLVCVGGSHDGDPCNPANGNADCVVCEGGSHDGDPCNPANGDDDCLPIGQCDPFGICDSSGICDIGLSSQSRLETWVVKYVDSTNQEWVVSSTLTQPLPDEPGPEFIATTGIHYTSKDNVLEFDIVTGATPFVVGDTFSFKTTGITDFSASLQIKDGKVVTGPKAVIVAAVDGAAPGAPLSGQVALTVNFDARQSTDPESLQLIYEWDFGDGSVGVGSQVSHTYTRAPTDGDVFTVTLRATNTVPQTGVATVDVTVINNSPSAVISANPTSGPAPLLVDFDAAGSSDLETQDPSDLVYQWDFDDGTTANSQGTPGLLFQRIENRYVSDKFGTACTSENPCTLTATLTVTDTGGASSTDSVVISVGNSSPVAVITVSPTSGTTSGTTNVLQVIFDASGSTDVDDGGNGDVIAISWDFGDGVELPRPPIGEPPETNSIVNHNYAPGTWHPTATLFDVRDGVDRGGKTEWTGPSITVSAPVPPSSIPIARFDFDPAPPFEVGQEFTVISTSVDQPNEATLLTHKWNFGDGTDVVVVEGLEPVKHTYSTGNASGFTVKLIVTDDEGNSAQKEKQAVVTGDTDGGSGEPPDNENQPPTAVFEIKTSVNDRKEDRAIEFDASDSSDLETPNSDLIFRWNFGDGKRAFGSGSDDFDTPSHTYVDPGTYTVLLTVSDEANASSDFRADVTVLSTAGNQPPVAVLTPGPRVVEVGKPIQLDGSLSFDEEGDPLTITWEFGDETESTDTESDETERSGPQVTHTYEQTGTFTVVMTVDDSNREDNEVLPSDTDEIRVTTSGTGTEPPPGADVPTGGTSGGSHEQRPGGSTFCGFGMLTGLFGVFLGLSVMRLYRRRDGYFQP